MDAAPIFKVRGPKSFFELPTFAHIMGQAFKEDNVQGKIMHPYRYEYPDGMDSFYLKFLQKAYFRWNVVMQVATDIDKDGKEVVVGFAQWTRKGESADAHGWVLHPWDPRNLLGLLAARYANLISYLYPDRAASPTKIDILERGAPFLKGVWTGARAEAWHLNFLAVLPSHQGKGIGRHFVRWGLDQAAREGVNASVIAAAGKDNFYRNSGFETIVANGTEGEGNPLAGIPGGNVWFVEARN